MSDDDKVIEVKNLNQGKNPAEQAINKLRESKIKEVQNKVDAQTKVAFDAKVVADSELQKLKDLLENLEFEKARVNEFAKSSK